MFLAWREIKHTKVRYALIGFIMILIIWLVLFVTGLANGLASDNASAIKESPASYYVLEKVLIIDLLVRQLHLMNGK